ncbi:MAG: GntR family transcriptional regulator [Brotaphodocola sp.]
MGSKSPLQIQAYEYLKEMILTGKLEPNLLYSETKMSSEIGISRTPMREAIQCLSQDGYITVVPSKGFMLRQLNEKDMVETIQIRCAIEGFCAQMAAAEIESKKGQKLLTDLKKLLERQEKVLFSVNGPCAENIRNGNWNKNSMNQFMDYDHKYHLALIDYVGNEEFQHTFQRLMYLIQLTTAGALAVPGRTEDTLREHKLIFEYLSEGKGDEAYKLMMVHLMMPLTMHLTD